MPLYTFRFDDGTEIDEVFAYPPPDHIEVDGERARRVPALFAAQVVSQQRKAEAAQGIVPWEAGMDRDVKRARQYRQQKQDEVRRKVIADTLAQF